MTDKEVIKVEVYQFPTEKDVKEKFSVVINRKETMHGIKRFLDSEFKGLKCDDCKEDSKGTVLAFMSVVNEGVSLRFKDFCCYDFQDKAHKTLK